MEAMTTLEIIQPILFKTYGEGDWTKALSVELANRIDNKKEDYRGRQHMIMMCCWDWMTGGTTAESVAEEIEEALCQ
jgi:hypothetical protein